MDAYLTINLEQSDDLEYEVGDLIKMFADRASIRS